MIQLSIFSAILVLALMFPFWFGRPRGARLEARVRLKVCAGDPGKRAALPPVQQRNRS